MPKIIDIEIAYELQELALPEEQQRDKKIVNAEKKLLKELREKHPIEIEVKFQEPTW